MHPLDLPLERLAEWLRAGEVSAVELGEEVVRRHEERDDLLRAYKHFDAEAVRVSARWADHVLRERPIPPPLCGIPTSVKDLYGVEGMPTFAGTRRRLPESWERQRPGGPAPPASRASWAAFRLSMAARSARPRRRTPGLPRPHEDDVAVGAVAEHPLAVLRPVEGHQEPLPVG